MKKILFTLFAAVLALPVIAQQANVNPVSVRVVDFAKEGGNVNVRLAVEVDGDNTRPTDSWRITPVIRSGANAQELGAMVINGNNKRKMSDRERVLEPATWEAAQPYATYNVEHRGVNTFTYATTFPFQEWMRGAVLTADAVKTSCVRELSYTDNIGTLAAPEPPAPYVITPHVAFITPQDTKERIIREEARVEFPVNVSRINPAFGANMSELGKIRETIEKVKANSSAPIKGIALIGYASPEGSYRNNERLARERVEALKQYVAGNFGVQSGVISTNSIPEDWEGLRRLVEAGNIEGKAAVLAIIDDFQDPDGKEASLKRGSNWSVLLRDYMPQLRRTEYRISFDANEATPYSKERALTEPAFMSQNELLRAANEYGLGTSEATRIFSFIERHFADDAVANNNVAAFKILRGDYASARLNLDLADRGMAPTLVNLGVVEMLNGNLDAAETYFKQASNDPQAALNLREIANLRENRRLIEEAK
ncbi:DUF3868 domain-containing protein [Alistipes sp. OttesenSCG-928-B03]|nr:DUF3868 domain-containing protein [Alistipes sp. OttesenSCG-928-B03]